MERRTFLKIVGATTGAAVVNPFKAFESLGTMFPQEVKGDVTSIAMGLMQISVGSSTAFIERTDRCLKSNLGMAAVKFEHPSFDLFRGGYELKQSATIRCSFKRKPVITGTVGRVEAVMVYPDGVTILSLIFPRARIKYVGRDIHFIATPVTHKSWAKMPLGKFEFI